MKSIKLFVIAIALILAFSVGSVMAQETFDSTAAEEEGYWYSRYNLGNLVMRSGMGETFMPDMQMMMMVMKMVDVDFDPMQKGMYGDGNHPMPPLNASLLQSVYKSGLPYYVQKVDVDDFATQKWDPASFDQTLTGLANGFTIIKEVEWAKQFHIDGHFGTPADNFGAQWRFVGTALIMEAKMQVMNFHDNMEKYDLSGGGDYVMLWAISDLGNTLEQSHLLYSTSNRYKDLEASAMMLMAADTLFGKIKDMGLSTIREKSLALQSLVWYAYSTHNQENRSEALANIDKIAGELKLMTPVNAAEKAYAIRGLIEAKRALGGEIEKIATLASELFADFDMTKGFFKSQNTYTIDDVAIIVGALNAMRIFESADVDELKAEEVFTLFFDTILNQAGMQQSAPPLPVAKSKFEYEGEPEIYFRHPDVPFPPMAGGKYGIAPVFASSVTYKDGKWEIDRTFDAAGAMHASNEMIWLHHDEVDGFPIL